MVKFWILAGTVGSTAGGASMACIIIFAGTGALHSLLICPGFPHLWHTIPILQSLAKCPFWLHLKQVPLSRLHIPGCLFPQVLHSGSGGLCCCLCWLVSWGLVTTLRVPVLLAFPEFPISGFLKFGFLLTWNPGFLFWFPWKLPWPCDLKESGFLFLPSFSFW